MCRTYEAFASGLHSCMDEILAGIRTLETQMIKKGQSACEYGSGRFLINLGVASLTYISDYF